MRRQVKPALRDEAGRILKAAPGSAASGRPSRSWKAPPTRSLERLRYVAHAFQRAGSGGLPAARWRYFQDAPIFGQGGFKIGARTAMSARSWLQIKFARTGPSARRSK